VLGDGYQAKMREPLTIYDPETRGISLLDPEPYVGKEGEPGRDRPPAQYRNTYNLEEELYEKVMSDIRDFEKVAPEIAEYESVETEGADLVIIAHGIVFRAVREAVDNLRAQGLRVGGFRPVTLRPLPVAQIRDLVASVDRILLVESSYGQMARLLKEVACGAACEMATLFKPGVGITSGEVEARAKEILK
jgi:2-oxoglutarate ferredoxin oxidoreductase subunit alpha